ncbi:aromatic compound dioxygenase [Rhizodiscina lignyota]|uniref:Aromatic compound dioxygenase n=1 Tax=Rhizodiscina lignyota TaxID=1504668 RepID=A0A9P4MBB8_9PEZI|nr:aromatic compound dioxygenase [Rhizodiscina lignyota]
MATNGATKNESNGTHKFDPDFTKSVIDATGPKANPRLKKVFGSLVQHLHDFLRENEVTLDEFFTAIEMVNSCGRMSDDKRNETQLLIDLLGVESLCDEITYKLATDAPDAPTATAILGPFWRENAPKLPMDASIVKNEIPDAEHTYIFGKVTDFATGKPIEGAKVDVWHTAPNGLYEQQDPDQPDMNLRGIFTTGEDGKYSFYCLRPTPYPIPYDGPAGKLLKLLDRHPMRPAHIHFILTAPNYKPLVTQIFDRRDKYISNDTVFAVKDSLVVDFKPREGDPKAQLELPYDFRLVSYEAAKQSVDGATELSTAGP